MTEEVPTFPPIAWEEGSHRCPDDGEVVGESGSSWREAFGLGGLWTGGLFVSILAVALLASATGLWGALSSMTDDLLGFFFLLGYLPGYLAIVGGAIRAKIGLKHSVEARPLWPFVVLGLPLSPVVAALAWAVGLMVLAVSVVVPYHAASLVSFGTVGQGLLLAGISSVLGGLAATGGFRLAHRRWSYALVFRVLIGIIIAIGFWLMGSPGPAVGASSIEAMLDLVHVTHMVPGLVLVTGLTWIARLAGDERIHPDRGRMLVVLVAFALSATFLSGGGFVLAALLL